MYLKMLYFSNYIGLHIDFFHCPANKKKYFSFYNNVIRGYYRQLIILILEIDIRNDILTYTFNIYP